MGVTLVTTGMVHIAGYTICTNQNGQICKQAAKKESY